MNREGWRFCALLAMKMKLHYCFSWEGGYYVHHHMHEKVTMMYVMHAMMMRCVVVVYVMHMGAHEQNHFPSPW